MNEEKIIAKNPDDYLDEYRAYVKSFIEDPNADLAALESFNEWLEEEEYQQKIRCRKCGSLNTEKRGKIKHCTDCLHEDKITPENQANWWAPITKEEAQRIKKIPLPKRSQAEEIKLAYNVTQF